jgi:hypothetical protein
MGVHNEALAWLMNNKLVHDTRVDTLLQSRSFSSRLALRMIAIMLGVVLEPDILFLSGVSASCYEQEHALTAVGTIIRVLSDCRRVRTGIPKISCRSVET